MKYPKMTREQQNAFVRASETYQKGEYSACYSLISELAQAGVARAYYCKAILEVDGNVPEASGAEAFEENAKKAVALKYPLAYGLLAKFYFECDRTDELAAFCLKNKKVKEPRFATLLAALYDGFYAGSKYENAKLAAKAFAAAEVLFQKELTEAQKGCSEWAENDLYASDTFALKYSYAFLNRLLMISYRYANVYQNRERYRQAYRRAVRYAAAPSFLFSLHRLNAEILMQDIMGLSDLKAVHESMQGLEDAYAAMSEASRENVEEAYERIWEQYREYYAAEKTRLQSLNIRADADFNETFKGRGVADMVVDLTQGVQRWADKPASKTTTVYTIGDKRYTADEYGVLVDDLGIRSDYRVDDVGRLYEDDKRLGYFSTDGIFMKE